MNRRESARIYDANEEEGGLMDKGKKMPILPVGETGNDSKPAAANVISMEEFEMLEDLKQKVEEESDREKAKWQALMDRFAGEIDGYQSDENTNVKDKQEMSSGQEILAIIKESGLDSKTVYDLETTMFNLIFEVTSEEIDQEKTDKIIELINATELDDIRKEGLILDLNGLISTMSLHKDDEAA
ncbi:MAG: hypothetical protein WCW66_03910 [Patescibacteria group bacterium]|jgi:hypothetical protein